VLCGRLPPGFSLENACLGCGGRDVRWLLAAAAVTSIRRSSRVGVRASGGKCGQVRRQAMNAVAMLSREVLKESTLVPGPRKAVGSSPDNDCWCQ